MYGSAYKCKYMGNLMKQYRQTDIWPHGSCLKDNRLFQLHHYTYPFMNQATEITISKLCLLGLAVSVRL